MWAILLDLFSFLDVIFRWRFYAAMWCGFGIVAFIFFVFEDGPAPRIFEFLFAVSGVLAGAIWQSRFNRKSKKKEEGEKPGKRWRNPGNSRGQRRKKARG